MAAVGRGLVRRGHSATFFHIPDLEAKALSEGLNFVPLGPKDYPKGSLAESVSRLAKLKGMAALKFSVQSAARIAEAILRDGPEQIGRSAVDVLLVDQNEPAGGSVAEFLGLPFVSVCTSLPLNREPLIPPPFVAWGYSTGLLSRIRNAIGYALADRLIAPIEKVLNNYRVRWKLPAVKGPNDTFSRLATIAQMAREFDFPRRQLPASFCYTGPWFDEQLSSGVSFPWDQLDERPIVYGSIGTIQDRSSDMFRTIAEACLDLDVQLVLSLGSGTGISELKLPGNPIVVNYAPQTELLSRSTLTITHCGMNTTQQSLHFGVPLVAMPLAHDQPAIAARLSRSGAGFILSPAQVTPSRLRAAVQSVLPAASSFRAGAAAMRDAIRNGGGVEAACDVAESVLKRKTDNRPVVSR
jgi:MGT family glycosyltransferase